MGPPCLLVRLKTRLLEEEASFEVEKVHGQLGWVIYPQSWAWDPLPWPSVTSQLSNLRGLSRFRKALGRLEAGLDCHLVVILDSAPTDASKGPVGWGDGGSGKCLGPEFTENLLRVCVYVYRHDLDWVDLKGLPGEADYPKLTPVGAE